MIFDNFIIDMQINNEYKNYINIALVNRQFASILLKSSVKKQFALSRLIQQRTQFLQEVDFDSPIDVSKLISIIKNPFFRLDSVFFFFIWTAWKQEQYFASDILEKYIIPQLPINKVDHHHDPVKVRRWGSSVYVFNKSTTFRFKVTSNLISNHFATQDLSEIEYELIYNPIVLLSNEKSPSITRKYLIVKSSRVT